MKKKIFSALLMGVFVMASMSMFVSCKDYDDDIDGLNLSQADLLSKIEALESTINANQTTLSEQLAAAQKKAEEALNVAQANGQDISNLKSLIDAANTAAADAGTKAAAAEVAANEANEKAAAAAAAAANASGDAAAAQTEAENAKAAAEQAKADAEQAKADAEEALAKAKEALENAQQGASSADVEKALADAKSALEKATSLETRVSQLETLTSGLDQLKQDVAKAVTKEEFEAYKKSVENYQAYFDNLFAMVTSVELYGTFNGAGTVVVNGQPVDLTMMHGNVAGDSKFGDDECAWSTSDPLITYVKGTDIKTDAGILLRVNPVNAQLSVDDKNCQIAIVNSKGERMDDYIKVVSVERYSDLITRSSDPINTGLWKVNFEFKEGVDMEAFEKAVTNNKKDVLFAVAVNNTDTIQSDRYVASTFDLTLGDEEFEPSSVLNFKANDKDVADLRNRWDGNKAYSAETGIDKSGVSELTWAKDKDNNVLISSAATDKNTAKDANDVRYNKALLPVEVNEDIIVEVEDKNIEYYYVVLDKNFAIESEPSEWNAWSSYTYDGLGTTVKGSEKLTLKITSDKANGDVIGFRVFAVNYDGNLVDPDGRAFYVAVGDAAVPQTISVDVTAATKDADNYTIAKLPEGFRSNTNALKGTFVQSAFDKDGKKSTANAQISYTMYQDEKCTKAATDWSNAKYIKVSLNRAQYFVDGETFAVVIKANDGIRDVNVLTVNVTKVMPTTAKEIIFKAGQLVNGVYTCYVDPNSVSQPDWTTAATYGYKALENAVTGLDNNFVWTFASAKKENNKTVDLNVTGSNSSYVLQVGKDFVDNKTEHATTIDYLYRGISLTIDEDEQFVVADYPVEALTCNTIFACALDNGVQTYDWTTKEVNYKKYDVNFINYSETTPGGTYLAGDKLTNYIVAENSYDSSIFGGKWDEGLYLSTTTGKDITAELLSDETGNADYYTVEYVNGDFEFTSKSGTTNPVADVPSTLVIKAKDAFGHTNTIKLPFTVKKK